MTQVMVPDIGDFKDVPVIEILVAIGQTISREQTVAVVESDKATIEIPSPAAGVIESIDVKIGDKVSKGSPLLRLGGTMALSAEWEDGEGSAEDAPFPGG